MENIKSKKHNEPVYILIRTSGRPLFFENMINSIKEQTYENIITICHVDNDEDNYAEGKCDIIVKGYPEKGPDVKSAPYNLYCNTLLKTIPEDSEGWYCFMDDDDKYSSSDVIERLVKLSKRSHINVGRADRGDGNIWPKFWRGQHSFQTQCFFLHTDHKDKSKWWDKKGGDHHYTKQLTDSLPINWIDGLIIATAQDGKGRGEKYDLGERPKKTPPRNSMVPVYFLRQCKSPRECQGEQGEIKVVSAGAADRLLQKKFIKVIDKSKYDDFINNI